MKKDKQKVEDEVWTIERVKDFLTIQTVEDVAADFHVLLKAYQAMRLENFAEFVALLIEDGRNINATNPAGKTVLSIIQQHGSSGAYADVLIKHGAG
jgi:hypothetical protein